MEPGRRPAEFKLINSIAEFIARPKTPGPLALVTAEDDFALSATVRHLLACGFAQVVVVADDPAVLAVLTGHDPAVQPVLAGILPEQSALLNELMPSLAGRWIHWCYNGEFLYFPFCESRTIQDAVAFSVDERRQSVFGYVIDLYQDQLKMTFAEPNDTICYFDGVGYFGKLPARTTSAVDNTEVFGGLRWRFLEHAPAKRKNIDRTCLFKTSRDLRLDAGLVFNQPDYNSISCPWHNNMTMAVASFRAAKALSINPPSNTSITSLKWAKSERFDWSSAQLLEAGFIEPGQWF